MNGIERLLAGSRYLTVITILLSMLAAVSLYIAAILSFIGVILQALGAGPWVPKVSKEAAIGILNIIDLLLIATGLQMVAIGIYRIFLNSELPVPPGLQISSFGELKVSMVKMVGIVLLVLFLENAFKLGPGQPILYFGFAIAVIIAAFAWAIKQEER